MAIDLLMPSYTSRMKTNQRGGDDLGRDSRFALRPVHFPRKPRGPTNPRRTDVG